MKRKQGNMNAGSWGEFYRQHANRWTVCTEFYYRSPFLATSSPLIKGFSSLYQRLRELAPGRRGLDAGCGAAARDVYKFWQDAYNVFGLDLLEENILIARNLRPEIRDRLIVCDLRSNLPFLTNCFDFVMCNAVIQHIEPEKVYGIVLPEISRVLRPRGVLQLLFKRGKGVKTILDRDFATFRTFQLYEENDVLPNIEKCGLSLVNGNDEKIGGIVRYTDYRLIENTVLFLVKDRIW